MKSALNHVAILVRRIEETAKAWEIPIKPGAIEEFPAEGTRELYVGSPDQSAKLLLMQAIGPGPYQEALEKRGPGLHHVALEVTDLVAFAETAGKVGWHLHPRSLHLQESSRTVFLCRAGTPLLVEVQEQADLYDQNPYLQRVEIGGVPEKMLTVLGCDLLLAGTQSRLRRGDAEFFRLP